MRAAMAPTMALSASMAGQLQSGLPRLATADGARRASPAMFLRKGFQWVSRGATTHRR